MANEVTLTASLTCNKPSVMNSAIGRSWTTLLSNMNGNYFTESSMIVTTTAVAIPLGQLIQPHYASFYNNPTFTVAAPTTTPITGIVNNGSGSCRITDTAHGYQTGDVVTIAGVVGTTEANGTWAIVVITANTFDLVGPAFTNAYVSGGTALLVPSIRIRNGATGADLAQLFSGQAAVIPLLVGATPFAICNPSLQLLEYLLLSY